MMPIFKINHYPLSLSMSDHELSFDSISFGGISLLDLMGSYLITSGLSEN